MASKAFSNAQIQITATDRTKSAFNSVNKSLASVTKMATSLGAGLLVAAGIGGMGALISKNMDLIDSLAKTSDRLGITTESLVAMRHAGNLAGVSNETLDKGLERLNVNLWNATKGTGAQAEALDALGLSADELARQPTDEAMRQIADAMQDVEISSEKAKIAQDLFGKSGIELINLLEGGAEAFDDARAETEAFGMSLSRVDAAKVEMANDAFDKAKKAIGAVGQVLAVQFAPLLAMVSNYFIDSAKASGGFANSAGNAMQYVITAVQWVIKTIWGIRMAWIGVQVVFSKVAEILMQGIENIAKPIVALLSIIPGLGVDYEETMAVMAGATNNVKEQTNELLNSLTDVALNDPSEMFMEYTENFLEAYDESALAIAEVVAEKQEAEREALANHRESMLNIEEEADKKGLKDKIKKNKAVLKLETAHYKNLTNLIDAESQKELINVSSHNKTLFKINKTAGIANALIGAYQGFSRAMGAYVYPLNIVMAGLSLASGLSNVSKLRSVSFSGGGGGGASGGGGGGGSMPAIPDVPMAEVEDSGDGSGGRELDATIVNIELQGTGYSKEGVRDLIEQINEEISDGVFLRPIMGEVGA